MACLADDTILAYGEGGLSAIETAQVRDHLLLCPACRKTAGRYRELERVLAHPVLGEPPASIVPRVIERLYPALPRITSVAAMIAASAVFLITWIYIYFDFSSSSLIQALRLTTRGTSGWLADIIKAISAVYNGAQAVYKAGSAVRRMLLPTPLSALMAGLTLLAVSVLLANYLVRPLLRKTRARKT